MMIISRESSMKNVESQDENVGQKTFLRISKRKHRDANIIASTHSHTIPTSQPFLHTCSNPPSRRRSMTVSDVPCVRNLSSNLRTRDGSSRNYPVITTSTAIAPQRGLARGSSRLGTAVRTLIRARSGSSSCGRRAGMIRRWRRGRLENVRLEIVRS